MTFEECDDIDKIVEICFNYYTDHEKEVSLTKKELRTCINWTHKALAYKEGKLDPRNQNIFATEQFFDIEIRRIGLNTIMKLMERRYRDICLSKEL